MRMSDFDPELIQIEQHHCTDNMKIDISKWMRVKTNKSVWAIDVLSLEGPSDIESTIYDIEYCPFCGEKLK